MYMCPDFKVLRPLHSRWLTNKQLEKCKMLGGETFRSKRIYEKVLIGHSGGFGSALSQSGNKEEELPRRRKRVETAPWTTQDIFLDGVGQFQALLQMLAPLLSS